METWIIKYNSKINGKFEVVYHEDIKNSTNKEAMNVYVEHVTSDKRKAKRFYDKDEAQHVANWFSSFSTSQVIKWGKK